MWIDRIVNYRIYTPMWSGVSTVMHTAIHTCMMSLSLFLFFFYLAFHILLDRSVYVFDVATRTRTIHQIK